MRFGIGQQHTSTPTQTGTDLEQIVKDNLCGSKIFGDAIANITKFGTIPELNYLLLYGIDNIISGWSESKVVKCISSVWTLFLNYDSMS